MMIKHIDIINLSHCDMGFTDHPAVCRQLQVKYLDRALALCLANGKKPVTKWFYWTIESNAVLADWWHGAGRKARRQFIGAVKAGWIEVCAMPFNNTPLINADQWRYIVEWLPDNLRKLIRPRVIMQSDVNGMPRAGVMAFMDRGAEFLWMSINSDTGGSPFPQPSAFWWRMPDGRRIFVWNSIAYNRGYYLFEEKEWRKGPVPKAEDTCYREPREGDFFRTTPENLKRANDLCGKMITEWLGPDCPRQRVAFPMTNMWRVDNDPPCALLPDFVAAWNAAGLKPFLAMATPYLALTALRDEWGKNAPEYEGEWTDWWVNGSASMPREMAAARKAKRLVAALKSRMFASKESDKTVKECLHDLCLFDEHTFGSWDNAAFPYSNDAAGQRAEKSMPAYRSLALAGLGVGEAARKRVSPKDRGVIHVVNPYDQQFAGWVRLPFNCLRGDFEGVEDEGTGRQMAFVRSSGAAPFARPAGLDELGVFNTAKIFPDVRQDKYVAFWIDGLKAGGKRKYRLLEHVKSTGQAVSGAPLVSMDKSGWPVKIKWDSGVELKGGWGEFYALEFKGDFPHWTYKQVFGMRTEAERRLAREKMSKCLKAFPAGKTESVDMGATIIFRQELKHHRLRYARRELEISKTTPLARLAVEFDRLSRPESAEVFYLRIPLCLPALRPVATVGGIPFEPGREQLPKSCRDFFGMDGDIMYRAGKSKTVVSCRDSALVSFGGVYDGLGVEHPGKDLSDIYAILFNNIWYTNFSGDESGVMRFEFDIYRSKSDFAGYAPAVFPVVRS